MPYYIDDLKRDPSLENYPNVGSVCLHLVPVELPARYVRFFPKPYRHSPRLALQGTLARSRNPFVATAGVCSPRKALRVGNKGFFREEFWVASKVFVYRVSIRT